MFGRNRNFVEIDPYSRELHNIADFYEALQRGYSFKRQRGYSVKEDLYLEQLHMVPTKYLSPMLNYDYLVEHEVALDDHIISTDCFCKPRPQDSNQEVFYHPNVSKAEMLKREKYALELEKLEKYLSTLELTQDQTTSVIVLVTLAKPIALTPEFSQDHVVILREDKENEVLKYNDITNLIQSSIASLANFSTDLGLILEIKDHTVMDYIRSVN